MLNNITKFRLHKTVAVLNINIFFIILYTVKRYVQIPAENHKKVREFEDKEDSSKVLLIAIGEAFPLPSNPLVYSVIHCQGLYTYIYVYQHMS